MESVKICRVSFERFYQVFWDYGKVLHKGVAEAIRNYPEKKTKEQKWTTIST